MTSGRLPIPLPMDEIADKYEAGRSLRSLGLTYNVNPSTIGDRLKKHGVQLRPPGRTAKPESWKSNHVGRKP